MLDVAKIRQQFPIYQTEPNLVYLDTAASSLKPQVVIDAMDSYYQKLGVNVHRGVYSLAYQATDLYDKARETVAKFIHAEAKEIIFTRGTTTSLNMVAAHYVNVLKPGDEIITSELEHHSSFLPWLNVARKTGATLKFIELNEVGRITVESFKKVLTSNTKVVAINYISNVMGYLSPVHEIIKLAHEKGAIVILDAAQAAPHIKIDVKALDVDFLAFSGHKMFGPSGVGALFGKIHLLNQMEPLEFGGDMVDQVSKTETTWQEVPYKFEAGTPIIAGAIGLAKAVEFIESIGFEAIEIHTKALQTYAVNQLSLLEDVKIYNPINEAGLVTFNIKGVHPHDAASIFDQHQICLRAGKHCAELITKWLGEIATLRATFYVYNTIEDVDAFIESVKEAITFFKGF